MSAGDLYTSLAGWTLLEDARMVQARQVRFPRSKRRRIIRKWAKRETNLEFRPLRKLLCFTNTKTVIGHPAAIGELRERIAQSGAAIGMR